MRGMAAKPSEKSPTYPITVISVFGSPHSFRIDAGYLIQMKIPMPEVTQNGQPDPLSMSISSLKGLLFRQWRNTWGLKPVNPSFIRLIFFGKLLDDQMSLKGKC
ncbi:uncharacterized protein FTOL_13794 [Fusarium torulosum]|uniref:Ubiquitin-like domain-containing protein n=1 Tax=Fusarium torulosum TaxID=33205 RepID=A0AAE8MMU6_9HYPO|nr:uncharacterized protein FTOL_13794 [Fusarium torulosum]